MSSKKKQDFRKKKNKYVYRQNLIIVYKLSCEGHYEKDLSHINNITNDSPNVFFAF